MAVWMVFSEDEDVATNRTSRPVNPGHVSLRTDLLTANLDKFGDRSFMSGATSRGRRIIGIRKAAFKDLRGNLRRSKNLLGAQLEVLRAEQQQQTAERIETAEEQGEKLSNTDLRVLEIRFETQKQNLIRERIARDTNIRTQICKLEQMLIGSAAKNEKAERS